MSITEDTAVAAAIKDGLKISDGSLEDELIDIVKTFKQQAPEELQDAILDHIKRWKSTDILLEACKKGDVAPDFVLPDENGRMVSSVDLRAKGPIVAVFFRGNWCPFCNATLRMLRKYTPHFKARGATVVAISGQTVEQSKRAVEDGGLTFPVLSDEGNVYSQTLNIAYEIEDEMKKKLIEIIGPAEQYYGDDSFVLPIPAAYVIGTDGRISYSFLELDYTKRAEPLDILNSLPPLKKNRRQSLQEKIEIEKGKLWDSLPEKTIKTLYERVSHVKNEGIEDQALRVGMRAPDFQLQGRDGQIIDSRKLLKKGPLVLTFHFGHRSPICMAQLDSMQRALSKFEAKGASMVAISPAALDSSSYQIAAYSGKKLPFLVDERAPNSVAGKFGLLYELPSQLFHSRSSSNVTNADSLQEVPMAATYVIDRSGMIIYASVNADPTRRPEPEEVLMAVPAKTLKRAALKRGPFSLLFGRRTAPRLGLVRA